MVGLPHLYVLQVQHVVPGRIPGRCRTPTAGGVDQPEVLRLVAKVALIRFFLRKNLMITRRKYSDILRILNLLKICESNGR